METKPKTLTIPYMHEFKNGKEVRAELGLLFYDKSVVLIHTKPTGGKERMCIPRHVLDSLLAWSEQKEEKEKDITVGHMVQFNDNAYPWAEYAGRYAIVTGTTQMGTAFSLLLFPAGHENPPSLKLSSGVIGSEVAWVGKNELIFINDKIRDNMEFYAKCKAEEDYVCPDCLEWNARHRLGGEAEDELECPKCGCLW